ncbi:MAG: TRL-like family protein [Proteobacteria bacterium]|nr:TRL-like family protein [Pseudomonadota bacterium]MBU4287968.1 TRL-like family protein [Pseudomonadota bacterium]MCG2756965.1 TRL-like family protein [Desulfobacteraceae bacterium]
MKQNRLVKLSLCLLAIVFLAGCMIAPVVPPIGVIYNNTRAPLDVDFEKSEYGPKTGTAYTNCILGLIAWGDASAEAAARDGGISIIEHVDYEYMNILFVYQRFTTIAHGK